MSAAVAAAARTGPRGPGELFVAFSVLALQGFGGVLGVVQRELVERRRWMSDAEFLEEWALAQVLPGPNVCNLALMVGYRACGLRGALAALTGLLALPLLTLLLVASAFQAAAGDPRVAAMLRGMGAVSVGIIAGTGIKLLLALRPHRLGAALASALALTTAVAVAAGGWSLGAVLLGVGGPACGLTWWRLRPEAGLP